MNGHIAAKGKQAAAPNRLLGAFSFGAGGGAVRLRRGAWADPERDFCWSLGRTCRLSLEAPEICSNLAVLIDLRPAPTCGAQPISLKTLYRGDLVLDVMLHRASVLLIPVGPIDAGAPIDLSFIFGLRELDVGDDSRNLAFAFTALFLIDQPAEPRRSAYTLPQAASTNSPPRDFLLSFQSLGHCDFGLFQRHFGAESPALLRFTGITMHFLIKGLIDRFKALDTHIHVEARTRPDWPDEYMAYETNYELTSHTFSSPRHTTEAEIVASETTRLAFLKRLFLETLDDASKIFVLRCHGPAFLPEAEAVAAVLRLHAANTLLWAVEDAALPAGAARVMSSYLIQGQLQPTGDMGRASIESWLGICLLADQVFRKR